ncbi:unnamed protein product [Meloidogyne enterolobii]|uniref:Uncharacterized protein n=1 Tax=Meloidogyne enterolobii TaxID=390850 RepID=A0ACB0ZL10_MELEN
MKRKKIILRIKEEGGGGANREGELFQNFHFRSIFKKLFFSSMLYYVVSLLSSIYCDGPILQAVQDARLFSDSKYFVDMPLKQDPVATLRAFYELGERSKDAEILSSFVEAHFDAPGHELQETYPEDWVPFPNSFTNIDDYQLRRWALHLHRIWRDLCRRVKDDVRLHQERYSLLYVPHPFIIPGGRFKEFYYWDSFWILKGLLFSEMYDTAKGTILNLIYMVENHGFVPNGGRVYYLSRSQPPLLTPMVYEYFLATGDVDFVQQVLPALEKEQTFWNLNRARSFLDPETKEELFQYYQYRAAMKFGFFYLVFKIIFSFFSRFPRPESYREDMEMVKGLNTDEEREQMWSNLASGIF